MLAPKRIKFRKWQKGRLRGPANRGATIAFGEIGLKAVEHGKLSSQQIEAARIAMMRHIRRGGKVWIRIFPDHPVTAKPLATRQGSGKGAPVGWCAPVKPGRVLYEIKGIELDLAKRALTLASHKLPVKTVIVIKEGAFA
jgi:large subunit ribosomal protein L16